MADTARDRAEAELRRDPARSNRLIAESVGCDHHVVARVRARLEQAGEIQPAPVRTPRYPNGPRALGRAQQAVADLGPSATTREIMDASGVGRCAAWHARTHPRNREGSSRSPISEARLADAAAATDALTVIRTPEPESRRSDLTTSNPAARRSKRRWPATDPAPDRHAPQAVAPRPPPSWYADPDPIETACCTLEWRDRCSARFHDLECAHGIGTDWMAQQGGPPRETYAAALSNADDGVVLAGTGTGYAVYGDPDDPDDPGYAVPPRTVELAHELVHDWGLDATSPGLPDPGWQDLLRPPAGPVTVADVLYESMGHSAPPQPEQPSYPGIAELRAQMGI